jgi:hypothetical protein
LLLVSPEFIGCDYIFNIEIPAIRKRLRACHGLTVPIVIRDCAWEMVAARQAAPVCDGRLKPIEDWTPHNKGFDAARAQIDGAIADHFGIRPGGQIWPRR